MLYDIINNDNKELKTQIIPEFGRLQEISESNVEFDISLLSANEILVRVINMADRFDNNKEIGSFKGSLSFAHSEKKPKQYKLGTTVGKYSVNPS